MFLKKEKQNKTKTNGHHITNRWQQGRGGRWTKNKSFFYGGRQVKSVVRFLKSVLMLIVKGQQTMIFAGIMICIVVRSIKTAKRRRPFGPKMYFLRSITHQDRTYVRYWGTVMKLPLTSDLFRFYPHLNNCIVGDWY